MAELAGQTPEFQAAGRRYDAALKAAAAAEQSGDHAEVRKHDRVVQQERRVMRREIKAAERGKRQWW